MVLHSKEELIWASERAAQQYLQRHSKLQFTPLRICLQLILVIFFLAKKMATRAKNFAAAAANCDERANFRYAHTDTVYL